MGEGIVSIFAIVDSLYDSKPNDVIVIDEPELLLHPLLANATADLIKKLKQNNIATIITTHSPTFLSHFIYEDSLNLIIMQKNLIIFILMIK